LNVSDPGYLGIFGIDLANKMLLREACRYLDFLPSDSWRLPVSGSDNSAYDWLAVVNSMQRPRASWG